MIKLANSAMLPLGLLENSGELEITRNVYYTVTNKRGRKPSLTRTANYDLILLL